MRQRRQLSGSAIPVVGFYGENDPGSMPEFVHIERLETRSSANDWSIAAHAHRGRYQIMLLLVGTVDALIDGEARTITAPAAITVAPAVVHSFKFVPGAQGYMLTIADALLHAANARRGQGFDRQLWTSYVIDLSAEPAVLQRISAMFAHLLDEFTWPRPGRAQMLDWQVRACLLMLARSCAAAIRAQEQSDRRVGLVAKFRVLVEQHYRDHWSVPQYAGALKVTPARLDRACARIARQSAFELINDRLVLEARRRLIYTTTAVTALADELGFEDPGYFCRFFKRKMGQTPSQYRTSGVLPTAPAYADTIEPERGPRRRVRAAA